MEAFIERHGVDGFEHLVDEDGSLWARFGVITQPTWIFIDDSGETRTVVGGLGEDGLHDELDRLAAD